MPGVYISYPFCSQKCTYCNFASGVFPRELQVRYMDGLIAELQQLSRNGTWPWVPETVYLGGGTPSQMEPEVLTALLGEIPGVGSISNADKWREATMEAAPGGITKDLAIAWRRAGINRVSLGVQSFDAREAQRTGRKHTAEMVEQEIAILRDAGIGNFNVDLIAGLPGQTVETFQRSLDWVEKLEAPHVSVYMLEVDDDSRLGAEVLALGKRYGAQEVPGDDQIADCYELAVERLRAMGIARYEISNFARTGCESVHNLKYWRREPYLGFGADAHSFDGMVRSQNVEQAQHYVDRLARGEPVLAEATDAKSVEEQFFLGLRLDQGIQGGWAPYEAVVQRHIEHGLLEITRDRLHLTARGVLLSNEVFADFIS